jgi:hypothetical protein
LGRIMRLAESFYGQTSTRQKSGARGLCVYPSKKLQVCPYGFDQAQAMIAF